MKRVAPVVLLALCYGLLLVPSFSRRQEETKPEFPTKDQITLLVTQAKHAFDLYENTLGLESQLSDAQTMLAGDRQVLTAARTVIGYLEKEPERFNSTLGFTLVTTLDDASRNAAVCMGQGATQAAMAGQRGDASSGQAKLNVSRACADASILLTTVSESAASLYLDYQQASDKLLRKAFQAADKCNQALKKLSKQP
jgi:hypothetical protein